jgi:two-component system cell cycle response regulator
MKRSERSNKKRGFGLLSGPDARRSLELKRLETTSVKAPTQSDKLREKYEEILQEIEQLYRQNERAAQQIRAIRYKLMGARSVTGLLQTLIDELSRRNVDHVSITLADDVVDPNDRTVVNFPAEIKKHLMFVSRSDLESALAPNGRSKTRIGNREDVDLLGIFGRRTKSCVVVPMEFRDTVIGSINLGAASTTRYTDDMAPDLLEDLAQTAALCLDNVITHERNEKLATTDALTKIHNRRYFYETATRTIDLANRHGDWVSCIYIDLNNFKHINDTYGHTMGDLALQKMVHYIQNRIRKTDLFARLGGDEFSVILPRIGQTEAQRLAEALRRGVAKISFKDEGPAELKLSAAFGVASIKGGRARLDDLINRADEAMYSDKVNKPGT